MEKTYKQTTFLSPVCTDNLGISSSLRSPSGCVNIAGVVEGRIALTSLPHPVHCVLPGTAQLHKEYIPLGCESDLLGDFNHLPLLDSSTSTATKHAGSRVQSDLKTSPARDFHKLEPMHCCNPLRPADRALLKPRWATQPLPHQCQLPGHLPQEKQLQGVQAGRACKGAELLV